MSSRGVNDDALLDEIKIFVFGRPPQTNGDTDLGDDGLTPQRFHSALATYERGGFPSNSMPEAISRSSEPPLPQMDSSDRRITESRIAYSRALSEAHRQLRTAVAIQNSWLLMVNVEDVEDPAPPICANGPCFNDAEQNRRLCSRCRKYKQRTQRDWGPAVELRDNVIAS